MNEDELSDMGAELLSNKSLIKVLSVLSEHGELNITAVSHLSGLNHGSTDKHLRNLMRLGLVLEKRYGSIRIFKTHFRALNLVFQEGRPLSVEVQG